MHGSAPVPQPRRPSPGRLAPSCFGSPCANCAAACAASASSSPASRLVSRRSPACPPCRARSPTGSDGKAARSSAATWRSRCSTARRPAPSALPRARGHVRHSPRCAPWRSRAKRARRLVEMKAVDATIRRSAILRPIRNCPPADLLAQPGRRLRRRRRRSALLARLDMKVGDRVRVGDATIEFRAHPRLRARQDRQRHRPRAAPARLAGRRWRPPASLQPGSLVRWTYRLDPAPGLATETRLVRIEAKPGGAAGGRLEHPHPDECGPALRQQHRALHAIPHPCRADGAARGGVGVANAVRGFVDRKRASMATLKSLGAPGGQVVAALHRRR